MTVNGAPRPNVPVALQVDYFHFGFGPGSERANLISSRCARWCTPAGLGLSSVAIAVALFASRPIDRSSPSSSGVHGGPGALISSLFSASWRGSDSIRVLLFSLTLRSGRAILRYNPRLLSSWPTSSTDAPLLRSIAEAVELSFPLHLQLDQAAEVFRQPAGARNGCLSEGHDGVQLDQIG